MYENLELEVTGTIATLSLNRPERLNALSVDTLRELEQAAKDIAERDDIRAVIVAGKGKSFSAGADLSGFPAPATEGARAAADAGRRMADAMEAIPQITIARIQGWCIGGGLVLAAACDLRVATDSTRFSIPEIDLGIPLAWGGIPRLVREVGPALIKELVITCRPFDAQEALKAGFLNHVVDEQELDAKVDELADAVARRPRFPVQATKRHVDAITAAMVGLERSWADADSLLAGLQEPECIEAREAYLAALAKKRSG